MVVVGGVDVLVDGVVVVVGDGARIPRVSEAGVAAVLGPHRSRALLEAGRVGGLETLRDEVLGVLRESPATGGGRGGGVSVSGGIDLYKWATFHGMGFKLNYNTNTFIQYIHIKK